MVSDGEQWQAVLRDFLAKSALEIDQMVEAVTHLPRAVIDDLAEGPWPEPFCGVCRALGKINNPVALADDEVYEAALLVAEFHDEPLTRRKERYESGLGKECYYRCLAVYAAAKVALDVA